MPGYISLHRDIQKHWLYEEERTFSRYEAWLDILMKMNHKDGKVLHNGTVEDVARGSSIWSMGDMEKHWGWSNKKVKRFLDCLVADEMLTYKSTTKKTYVTVINYGKYQGDKDEEAPPKHHQSTTNAYQKHTNNNVNNENNVNKEELKPSRPKRVYDTESIPYRSAKYLLTKIKEIKPDVKEPNIQTWANDMRLLIEIDKRDPSQVGKVIDWVFKDSFWCTNILSPSKLRDQWDKLTLKMNQPVTISSHQNRKDEQSREVEKLKQSILMGGVESAATNETGSRIDVTPNQDKLSQFYIE